MDEFSITMIGLACALFSGTIFGSMFTPIRKYDIRDGFFVQWIQSATIFVCGMIVNFVLEHPKFEPMAALGGLIFATSNITSIPLVNKFGAGLAILYCGSIQIIVGWATARFGFLGIKAQEPASPILNYVGIVLTLGSGIMFSLVKNKPTPPEWAKVATVSIEDCCLPLEATDEKKLIDGRNRKAPCFVRSQHCYLLVATLSGALSGLIHTPVSYAMDNVEGASQEDMEYVFSYFCGIFFGSTVYFVIYCIAKKNRPYVSPELTLPSVLYGLMWTCAMISWFFANKNLSVAISFPIVTRIPGIVGACWDVLYFKSIKGTKNLLLLAVAISIALAGVISVGLSK
uniref:Transmembrane protein 144 n=1 Tax=Plectus sambesii TaxID=2011161 RepID=A0A914XHT0_9BILA